MRGDPNPMDHRRLKKKKQGCNSPLPFLNPLRFLALQPSAEREQKRPLEQAPQDCFSPLYSWAFPPDRRPFETTAGELCRAFRRSCRSAAAQPRVGSPPFAVRFDPQGESLLCENAVGRGWQLDGPLPPYPEFRAFFTVLFDVVLF